MEKNKLDKNDFINLHSGHQLIEESLPIVAILDETDGNGADLVAPTQRQMRCVECNTTSDTYPIDVPETRN